MFLLRTLYNRRQSSILSLKTEDLAARQQDCWKPLLQLFFVVQLCPPWWDYVQFLDADGLVPEADALGSQATEQWMQMLGVVDLADLLALELLRVEVKVPMRLVPRIGECRAPSDHSWLPKRNQRRR